MKILKRLLSAGLAPGHDAGPVRLRHHFLVRMPAGDTASGEPVRIATKP